MMKKNTLTNSEIDEGNNKMSAIVKTSILQMMKGDKSDNSMPGGIVGIERLSFMLPCIVNEFVVNRKNIKVEICKGGKIGIENRESSITGMFISSNANVGRNP